MFKSRMKTLARKTGNPRFNEIHLYTFRHCKALREYHKTRCIEHVKYVMGHKDIRTTHHYLQLYKQVYGNLRPKDYIVKVARTTEEAVLLIKEGFEKADEINGEHLYRRPRVG